MKRYPIWIVVVTAALVAVPSLSVPLGADVKTREKSQTRFEGLMGGFLSMMGGGRETTSTVAVKGTRLSQTDDSTGQIIDLAEQKVYTLDVRRKEYTVMTFAEMRKKAQEAKAEMEKRMQGMKPEEKEQVQQVSQQLEFDADVKETGERKSIGGQDTRQVILTIIAKAKGKTLEEGGGFVMVNDMWMGPHLAALDEVGTFYMKFVKAVYGDIFAGFDPRQMAGFSAMMPAFQPMAERMQAERGKLQGTPMLTTTTFETVKSAEQMKAASQQQSGGGGGITGGLASRLMRGRGQTQARTKVMTSTREVLSIAASASDADVAMPMGFKEKK
jgi:hypothetical protein